MIKVCMIILVVFGVLILILEMMNWQAQSELKELKQYKPKKYTKEEKEMYNIFREALKNGVEVEFSGIKCKMISFNKFSANGRCYDLNIENFLKVLKGE